MRNMILTLCLLPLCSSLVGAQLRTDRDMVGLKGPVKTVKIETIEISQADMKPINRPSWIREVVTTFDEKGYKAEEELFNPPGALFRKMLFKCDAKREKCERASYKPDGTLIRKESFDHKYNADGKEIEIVVTSDDGKLWNRLVRTYNSRGQFIEGATYDEQGALISRSVYTFDEKGRLSGSTTYNRSGIIVERQVITDEDYEISIFKDDGTLLTKWNRKQPVKEETDSYGNWTLQRTPMTVFQDSKSEVVFEVVRRTITYY